MAGANNGQVFSGSALDVATATVEGALAVGGNLAVTGTQTFTGNQAVAGTMTVTGLSTLTGGLAPSKGYPGTSHPVSSSLNAHVTSATVTGNDAAGTVVIVIDGTGVVQNQTLFVLTFANATLYTATPAIILTNQTAGAASTTLFAGTYGAVTASATAFSVVALGAALTASGTFSMGYSIVGIG